MRRKQSLDRRTSKTRKALFRSSWSPNVDRVRLRAYLSRGSATLARWSTEFSHAALPTAKRAIQPHLFNNRAGLERKSLIICYPPVSWQTLNILFYVSADKLFPKDSQRPARSDLKSSQIHP